MTTSGSTTPLPKLPTREEDGGIDVGRLLYMITRQNWKNGGILIMDVPEAEALLESALTHERERCADIADQHNSIEGIAQNIAAEIRKLEP